MLLSTLTLLAALGNAIAAKPPAPTNYRVTHYGQDRRIHLGWVIPIGNGICYDKLTIRISPENDETEYEHINPCLEGFDIESGTDLVKYEFGIKGSKNNEWSDETTFKWTAPIEKDP